ncbi:MAG TPA: patatin-like phospholipase family protein [Deltaproteobacteria bacterium]|nr:patatin-like phospholipase family protein [Deltaproteobacteria bacterium]
MDGDLLFLAGKNAWERIKQNGLRPGDISVVAGAAGAAKWLAIAELDKVIFSRWLKDRTGPLHLYGTSIGSWKLASAVQSDPETAIDALADAYIHQKYNGRVTPRRVKEECRKILDSCFPGQHVSRILSHPVMRFNLTAVRCRGVTGSDTKAIQFLGLALAFLLNRASRRLLSLFFERAFFYDPREEPPFFEESEFPIQRVPLDEGNFRHALLATSSIPLVMDGIRDIAGANAGVYRDGGILDYHPASFSPKEDRGIILYPHFSTRLIPGWFDKTLRRRNAHPEHQKDMLMLVPSPQFISRLPFGRIPDRADFKTFDGREDERVAFWKEATSMGKILADEFMESVLSGSIRTKVMRLEGQPGQAH